MLAKLSWLKQLYSTKQNAWYGQRAAIFTENHCQLDLCSSTMTSWLLVLETMISDGGRRFTANGFMVTHTYLPI